MFYTFVLLPKSIPQKFSKFFFDLIKTLTSRFQCLKLAIAKVLFFLELLASALFFTFVENELSLEPWLLETSSLLVHIPANVGSQLIDNFTL